MNLTPFTHPDLQLARVAHGFFGRAGGVSDGIYAGLNCGLGSRDVREKVIENRARVAQHFGVEADRLCTLYQVHSPDVVTVTLPSDARPEADAMVTKERGLVLGILTADCGPVLFADAKAGVIGAAHAGWKGAFYGVLENTVKAMETLGARREHITAVLGPTIAQPSYEVGPEFIARFNADDQTAFFRPSGRPDHHLFNLPAFIARQLKALGLQHTGDIAMDTRARNADFFSYRRTTLEGAPDYGRQISAIALTD